jgi:hypothetical protein
MPGFPLKILKNSNTGDSIGMNGRGKFTPTFAV